MSLNPKNFWNKTLEPKTVGEPTATIIRLLNEEPYRWYVNKDYWVSFGIATFKDNVTGCEFKLKSIDSKFYNTPPIYKVEGVPLASEYDKEMLGKALSDFIYSHDQKERTMARDMMMTKYGITT